MKKNPFADSSGMAKKGFLDEWFAFREKQWKEYLDTLSPDERAEVLERKRNIADRMASEVSVSIIL